MTSGNTPLSLTGRAVAIVGFAVVCISLTKPYASDVDINLWDVWSRTQYAVLGAEVLAAILVVASLFAVAELLLLTSALLGAIVLGFYLPVILENSTGLGSAWAWGAVGSAIALVGVSVALAPLLAARTPRRHAGIAFPTLEEAPPAQPEMSPAPAAQNVWTESPDAGWYADPAGNDRLRYWDGHEWSDQTR